MRHQPHQERLSCILVHRIAQKPEYKESTNSLTNCQLDLQSWLEGLAHKEPEWHMEAILQPGSGERKGCYTLYKHCEQGQKQLLSLEFWNFGEGSEVSGVIGL